MRGLGDACRALAAPIVGGNVSLYNESPPIRAGAGPIYPTPVVGMVGKLPDVRRAGRSGFVRAGDAIAIVGPFAPSLAASELAKLRGEPLPDGLPAIDLAAVLAAQATVRDGVRGGALSSAPRHRRGRAGGRAGGVLPGRRPWGTGATRGGIVFGAEEAGATGREGIWSGIRQTTAAALFGEGSGAFVVSGDEVELRTLGELTPVRIVGSVGGDVLQIEGPVRAREGEGEVEGIELTLAEMARAHGALAELFA